MNPLPFAGPAGEDFQFAALSGAQNYRAAVLADFSEFLHGQVLEVGAGVGKMTGGLLQNSAIQNLVSLEPEARFCAQLRAAFPRHQIIQGTVDDLKSEGPWNAILNVNVLEHIREDERELAAYRRLLSPTGGTLCLFVPARPEIYAPIDRDFGHFRRYTKPELRQKLKRAGFKIIRLRYYNLAGYFAWWWFFCLMQKRTFSLSTVRWFDRFIFPPVHAWEANFCAPPFGQSLLAVAQAE